MFQLVLGIRFFTKLYYHNSNFMATWSSSIFHQDHMAFLTRTLYFFHQDAMFFHQIIWMMAAQKDGPEFLPLGAVHSSPKIPLKWLVLNLDKPTFDVIDKSHHTSFHIIYVYIICIYYMMMHVYIYILHMHSKTNHYNHHNHGKWCGSLW